MEGLAVAYLLLCRAFRSDLSHTHTYLCDRPQLSLCYLLSRSMQARYWLHLILDNSGVDYQSQVVRLRPEKLKHVWY